MNQKGKNVFFESQYQIAFDVNAVVIKVDQHRFFSYISGRGFKSVDFMVLSNSMLYLIEVKNFIQNDAPDEEVIAKVFYQKCEDTMRLIELVHQYLSKKWHYKLLHRYPLIYKTLFTEAYVWSQAYTYQNDNRVILIGDIAYNGS